MKNSIKILCLLLAALWLAGCAGGQDQPTQPTQTTQTQPALSAEASYRVTVTDALGQPWTTGVIVRFLQNGEQAAMQVVNEAGVAEKTLPRGDYAVELMFTDDASLYHYEQEGLTLSAEKTELTVVLTETQNTESATLYVGSGAVEAFPVEVGGTHVTLTPGQRNYFLFTPTVAGRYEIRADGDTVIGYYGAPHFVQELSAAEVTDNAFVLNIRTTMIGTGGTGTTVAVIGIDAGADTRSCVLTIERTGEPEWSVEDEPWMIYTAKTAPVPYTLDEGLTVKEFDLTAATGTYALVLGSDGAYHLGTADGPLVLMRLGKSSKYLASFQEILDRSGVVKYFYNEDGNFDRKESYSECLLAYIACMDEDDGVYPLTEDLLYILQQRGGYCGWWEPGSSMYLFVDAAGVPVSGINHEIAWLFMCCYAE